MEVEWKKDMHQSYLLLKKTGENSYCVNMLLNNDIKGLIRPEQQIVDNQCIFRYNVTSLPSVSHIIEKLCGGDLKKLLYDLMETLVEGKEYLLNEDDYVLEPEYMFYSVATKELRLCYLDGYHKQLRGQIRSFMEYLMGKISHKDKDNVLLVYGLHQISTREGCTFKDLVHHMDTYQREEKDELVREEARKGVEPDEGDCGGERDQDGYEGELDEGVEGMEDVEAAKDVTGDGVRKPIDQLWPALLVVVPIVAVVCMAGMGEWDWQKASCIVLVAALLEGYVAGKTGFWNVQKGSAKPLKDTPIREEPIREETTHEIQRDVYREDTYMDEEDDASFIQTEEEGLDESTVILTEEGEGERRYLLRPHATELYQDISVVEMPFFIGKLKTKADGVIDNKLISRYHAKIHKEGEEFYLTDLASTNGTFLNGERLGTNEKRKLYLDDEVGFANITYHFTTI